MCFYNYFNIDVWKIFLGVDSFYVVEGVDWLFFLDFGGLGWVVVNV